LTGAVMWVSMIVLLFKNC